MTRFRLNAGRPASFHTSGSSAFSRPDEEEAAEVITRAREWRPNMEPDVLLKCGDWIPWPVVSLLGDQPKEGGKHGDVWCSDHGWQSVTATEKNRTRRAMKQCSTGDQSQQQSILPDTPPF